VTDLNKKCATCTSGSELALRPISALAYREENREKICQVGRNPHLKWQALYLESDCYTSQQTIKFAITKASKSVLYMKIITVYCEMFLQHTNTLSGKNLDFFLVLMEGPHFTEWNVLSFLLYSCFSLTQMKIIVLFLGRSWQPCLDNEDKKCMWSSKEMLFVYLLSRF
jgi:hypothetical protein